MRKGRIANFLSTNGIAYVYEQPYEIDTRTSEYGQYYPDFYLPDYNIYIEYFGINKNGDVPSYFSSKNGMTARQAYHNSMEWKRELHKENNTIMIECFAYEKFDGSLLTNLQAHLNEHSVELSPKSPTALIQEISQEDNSILDGIIELFETIINLVKSNGYTIENLRELNVNNSNVYNNEIIINLLEPIFDVYNSQLKKNDEIDFNDMINLARQFIETGKYRNSYKYVIVDEYQDISKARYMLLKSLRESLDYDLFCVGDDWQSIYQFAGSDIGFILNFAQYWGCTEISRIETTYRFSQRLIDISGSFIMKNPAQINKSIRGNSNNEEYVLSEVNGYTESYAVELNCSKSDKGNVNSMYGAG